METLSIFLIVAVIMVLQHVTEREQKAQKITGVLLFAIYNNNED